MRVTVEYDDGKGIVLQDITDLYVAYRQQTLRTDGKQAFVDATMRSHSWGANVRELVKELQQSLVELQDFLRATRGGSS